MFLTQTAFLTLVSMTLLLASCGAEHHHTRQRTINDQTVLEKQKEDGVVSQTAPQEVPKPAPEVLTETPKVGTVSLLGAAPVAAKAYSHSQRWVSKRLPIFRGQFREGLRRWVEMRRERRKTLFSRASGFFQKAGYRLRIAQGGFKWRRNQPIFARSNGVRLGERVKVFAQGTCSVRGRGRVAIFKHARRNGGRIFGGRFASNSNQQVIQSYQVQSSPAQYAEVQIAPETIVPSQEQIAQETVDFDANNFPDAQLETINRIVEASDKIASTFADHGVMLDFAKDSADEGDVNFSESQAELLEQIAHNADSALNYFVANNVHELKIQADCADGSCLPNLNKFEEDEGCGKMSLNLTPQMNQAPIDFFNELKLNSLNLPIVPA